jgi:hypothetical protein
VRGKIAAPEHSLQLLIVLWRWSEELCGIFSIFLVEFTRQPVGMPSNDWAFRTLIYARDTMPLQALLSDLISSLAAERLE